MALLTAQCWYNFKLLDSIRERKWSKFQLLSFVRIIWKMSYIVALPKHRWRLLIICSFSFLFHAFVFLLPEAVILSADALYSF